MKNRSKVSVLMAIIMVIVLAFAACGDGDSAPAATTADEGGAPAAAAADVPDDMPTVPVGVLFSLTGPMAVSEIAVRDATILAIEELNAAGGVLGHHVVPIEADGASEPSVFATMAERLIASDNVVTVFGCWTSAARQAVLPLFEEYNNLLWYPIQYEGMEMSPNIIYTGSAPNQQIVPAISFLVEQGYERFFLLGSDYVFPRTANMIIEAQVLNYGLTVTDEMYAQMDQVDFATIITAIEASGADVIVNTLNGISNVAFFNQMEERGNLDDFTTMSFSIAEEEVAAIGPELMAGHLVSWTYFQTTQTPQNDVFVDAFQQRFGAHRVTSDPVEAAYIGVHLWAAAVEAAGSFDVDAVLAEIRTGNIEFQAPTGRIFICGRTQHLHKPVRIGQVDASGLIYEIPGGSGGALVAPDPFLEGYYWAAGLS